MNDVISSIYIFSLDVLIANETLIQIKENKITCLHLNGYSLPKNGIPVKFGAILNFTSFGASASVYDYDESFKRRRRAHVRPPTRPRRQTPPLSIPRNPIVSSTHTGTRLHSHCCCSLWLPGAGLHPASFRKRGNRDHNRRHRNPTDAPKRFPKKRFLFRVGPVGQSIVGVGPQMYAGRPQM